MVKIEIQDHDGKVQSIEGEPGASLMEALRDGGVEISSICGGTCSCGTCHVFLSETWFERLSRRSDDELDLLETLPSFKPQASRLSCQIQLNDDLNGLRLEIAPDE
jgi:2Fe-2S ferredoxin